MNMPYANASPAQRGAVASARKSMPYQNRARNAVSQPQPSSPRKELENLMHKMEPGIKAALPANTIDSARFTRICFTIISQNSKILESCDPLSFIEAVMQAAQLGLEPNTSLGHCYLIPYGGKVSFQMGYQGYLELVQRSGRVTKISAHTVHENDVFDFAYGMDDYLVHKPVLKDRGEPIAYYATYKLINGGTGFEIMSVEDINAHRDQFSKASRNGKSPWQTSYDSMAKKTVLLKLMKYLPKQAIGLDLATAIATDGRTMAATSSINSDDLMRMNDKQALDFAQEEPIMIETFAEDDYEEYVEETAPAVTQPEAEASASLFEEAEIEEL